MPSRRERAGALPAISGSPSPIQCYLDELDGILVRGWAFDPTMPAVTSILHVVVDGQEVASAVCDADRPDVLSAGKGPRHVGYKIILPLGLGDGVPHRLMFRDQWRREVDIIHDGKKYSSLDFTVLLQAAIQGNVDGLRSGGFEGWVMRTDIGAAAPHGDCVVRISCDGLTVGHARANQHRGDAARAFNGPSNCGFRFTPPASLRSAYARRFQFFIMPENIELDGSPCETSLVADQMEVRLLTLMEAVDATHRDLTRIRRQLHELAPKPGHTISEYDRWFRLYEPALQRRIQSQTPSDAWASGPLVSIICPVYKPNLEEFRAAVNSVIEQSYRKFELILVDDNSRVPELSEYLEDLARREPRVRLLTHKKNRGISGATNTALGVARGEFIGFFDHDDLLVSVAVECMVAAAQSTGADMLYSDEDKIDAAGNYSAPALKPDWNHRLMLGVNYVCHFLFVRRNVVKAAGPLSRVYDGAQDHELILRISEHIAPRAIHHVPEVLYHWRIAPGSTSQAMSNKSYAAAAGIKAVSDHLSRLGRPADVSSIDGQTFYRVRWPVKDEPLVTIIIPYKDQIETTERCLASVLKLTAYSNYSIVMVDNWSTLAEAEDFRVRYASDERIKFLRVEEEFNYSRLNNLAVHKSDAEFFMFMNNDLFVQEENWLHILVLEAMNDPLVGAVGGKFVYPDGSIQHGGTVLGIGGVAGHVHVGLRAGDFGYADRLLFAQEMSAVTAAGVLVRADAFRAVGGFDEATLRVAFNDVDFCLKLGRAGYKIIWTPEFVAEHHESLSRGDDERPMQETRFFNEVETIKQRWGDELQRDRFYHPKFTLDRKPFFDLVDPH